MKIFETYVFSQKDRTSALLCEEEQIRRGHQNVRGNEVRIEFILIFFSKSKFSDRTMCGMSCFVSWANLRMSVMSVCRNF